MILACVKYLKNRQKPQDRPYSPSYRQAPAHLRKGERCHGSSASDPSLGQRLYNYLQFLRQQSGNVHIISPTCQVGGGRSHLIAFHTILATCSGENVRVTKQPSNMPLINTVQRNYMIYCIQDPSMYCCQVQLIKTANLRTPKATTNLSTPTATEHTHWSL